MITQGLPQVSDFPLKLESEHFIIHFGLRNPATGKGRGCQGVRDRIVILTYLEALERLYRVMTDEPWNRPPPVVDVNDKKTHVYVCDNEPFTSDEPFLTPAVPFTNSVPYIVLSCRSDETTTQAELNRAAAEAVHEATHVFNYTDRPHDSLLSKSWAWFDEGFAVFMETLVAAGNPDYFRFLANWIDMPEVPLDDPNARYQAGMFVRYLAKRLGNKFVNEVWTKSAPRDKPFDAIQKQLTATTSKPSVLISSNPDQVDLFASGYCMDPYFLSNHESDCLAPDVFARYGERAIAESVMLDAGETSPVMADALDHLACRYYRFYLKSGVRKLEVTLKPKKAPTSLKAEMAVVNAERCRSAVEPLRPAGGAGPVELSAVTSVNPDEVDHIVLVVSNCGTQADIDDESVPHDDNREYDIIASAT